MKQVFKRVFDSVNKRIGNNGDLAAIFKDLEAHGH